MNGFMADEDKQRVLDGMLLASPWIGSAVQMGLTVSPVTWNRATTIGVAAAAEAAWLAYTRRPITSWFGSNITTDGHALAFGSVLDFLNSSGAITPLILGWFLVDTSVNKLMFGQDFVTPFQIPDGSTYSTTPFIQLTGEAP